MLNDDATVLDDGTTARFGETRYFLTTTTAQAAEVMSWLEFSAANRVDGSARAGGLGHRSMGRHVGRRPARAARPSSWPFPISTSPMRPCRTWGCERCEVEGVPLRLLRLSFSGELAYELYAPADRGIALWERLLDRAAPLGLKPYGLEALASLRIEKGHVAGPRARSPQHARRSRSRQDGRER